MIVLGATVAKKNIIIILHGGLGNQLFQYFIGRLQSRCADNTKVRIVSDFLGRYGSPRDFELLPLVASELGAGVQLKISDFILKARLPKVIRRMTGKEMLLPIYGYGTLVDGYFQEISHYQCYLTSSVGAELNLWRNILMDYLTLDADVSGLVTHIRLGDFFNDREAARSFAVKQLSAINASTDLITDQEDVLTEELAKMKIPHSVRLLPTAHMTAWDLMKLMCRYESISTNGSTLAFWSAVIRGVNFESTNNHHESLFHLFTQAGNLSLKAMNSPGFEEALHFEKMET